MSFRIIFFLLSISYYCSAKEIKGYYVTLQNDTVAATFNIKWFIRPSLYKLQNKTECVDINGKNQLLTPQNTSSFTLFLPDATTTFSSIKWSEKEQQHEQFMIDQGGSYLKLYAYITLNSYDKSESYNHIFKKQDQETITEIPTINFRRDMTKYFDDCPDLAEKIQKKEYTRENLTQIVEMYNTYQSNKTKK